MALPSLDLLEAQSIDLKDMPFGSDFFEKLLDALYDGVYFVDKDRRILFWNRGAERLTGYTQKECRENVVTIVFCSTRTKKAATYVKRGAR